MASLPTGRSENRQDESRRTNMLKELSFQQDEPLENLSEWAMVEWRAGLG